MRAPLVALALICLAAPALADRIDGDWCAPKDARTLHIDGPAIVTPGGRTTTGEYSRHHFTYSVPAGEPGAGGTVEMRLLSEEEVEVIMGDSFETWRRCQLNS